MFFTYLRRELRRRMRQAVFIALGLALGIGLVITVSAASTGIQDSQTTILHSLYGVGTDITITQPPAKGSDNGTSFSIRQDIKDDLKGSDEITPGAHVDLNELTNTHYGTIDASKLDQINNMSGVKSTAAGLALVNVNITGTVPEIKRGAGSVTQNFTYKTSTVFGVDPAHTSLGPLSAASLSSGRSFTASDAKTDHAVVDSNYAKQHDLKVNDKINVGGTTFTIVGIVNTPQASAQPDVYVPLDKAQSLGKSGSTALTNKVNTIYVSADSATDISSVQTQLKSVLPSATITSQSDLASEVTGSLANASSLVNNLGKWVSAAVLVAAFMLASLLTMAAVARRVREFGTLKALGWRSRRIILQVMGESLVIGIIGGVVGVALGYGGAALIEKLAPPLTATVGVSNAATATGANAELAKSLTDTAHTVSVTLSAPVTLSVILLAVVLAVAAGLIAGSFGGWRAARLRPAAALSRVE